MTESEQKIIFSNNLRRLLAERDFTQTDLVRKFEISKSTASNWYNGSKMPRMGKIDSIAQWLKVFRSELLEEHTGTHVTEYYPSNASPLPSTHLVPRLGSIACGEPLLAEQNIEEYDKVPDWIKCDFTLVCKGDSMIGARIYDGDIVCIRSQPTVENGQIAAVLIDGEYESGATLKRIRKQDDTLMLMPENSKYEPLIFTGQDTKKVHILGLATHFISKV